MGDMEPTWGTLEWVRVILLWYFGMEVAWNFLNPFKLFQKNPCSYPHVTHVSSIWPPGNPCGPMHHPFVTHSGSPICPPYLDPDTCAIGPRVPPIPPPCVSPLSHIFGHHVSSCTQSCSPCVTHSGSPCVTHSGSPCVAYRWSHASSIQERTP